MKTIDEIKNNISRTITGNITKVNEFKYDNGLWVRPGIEYTIYYTTDKEEYFVSKTLVERIIVNVRTKSMFTMYKEASTGPVGSTKFVRPYKPKITKKNKSAGYLYRYFARQSNNEQAPIIEIKDSMFLETTSFYVKLRVRWEISGTKDEVSIHNYSQLQAIQKYFNNDRYNLDIIQFWLHDLTKKEETLKKLNRL